MSGPGRPIVAVLAAVAGAAVAVWSAGSAVPSLSAFGPRHANSQRASLMDLLGTVSAAGSRDSTTLETAARVFARRAPLDDSPFLVIGALAEQGGDVPKAEALYAAGLARNPRSRGAHYMLAGRALAGRDADAALRHLAALARQSVGARPEFANIMLAVAGDPALEPSLRRFLAGEPGNRDILFAAMAADPKLADRLVALAPPLRTAPAWLPTLAATYVAAGRPERAAAAWDRFGGGADPRLTLLRNPTFAPSAIAAPFGWTFDTAEAGAAAPGQGGLDVESYGREAGRLAAQWMLLPAGRYTLATDGSGDVRGLLEWRIQCLGPTPRPIASLPAGTPGTFVVPEGCTAQSIELWTQAQEGAAPVSGKLAAVRLEASR